MELNQLIEKLGYDEINFNRYLEYHKSFGYFDSFLEMDLLDEGNLELFLADPFRYEAAYLSKVSPAYHEFISYLAFCRSFYLFPFDEEKFEDFRRCDNCRYCLTNDSNDTLCGEDYVYAGASCEEHTFSWNITTDFFIYRQNNSHIEK